ncbi:unnamed protein product [Phytomonas sp. Hart1]|nr:unnamed protein product [Phytomonas sp. Hart1]|eukprot:CCW70271.1 unnamed protein product [Phytomonas sp. isolate Hart1]
MLKLAKKLWSNDASYYTIGDSNCQFKKNPTFWKDIEIRFNESVSILNLCSDHERVIKTFNHVEDAKGGHGFNGIFVVTNFRVLWFVNQRKRNLSIGLNTILNLKLKITESKLFNGKTESLWIFSKYRTQRYNFIFNFVSELEDTTGSLFHTVRGAWWAYDGTRRYREVQLRAALVEDGTVVMLPREVVVSRVSCVERSTAHGITSGAMLTTNIRVVWWDGVAGHYCLSIPYRQFAEISARRGEKGPTLYLRIAPSAASTEFVFIVKPVSRVVELYQEICSLWKTWCKAPVMEGEEAQDSCPRDAAETNIAIAAAASNPFEHVDSEKPTTTANDAFFAYFADEGNKAADRRPVYDPSIGLAVEKLRRGVQLKDLWEVAIT